MLPVYEAIGFEKVMLGGTTRPWLINVLAGHKPVPYVVKLYTEKYNEDNNAVLKEVICSNLANQFEIETPAAALIEFTNDFVDSLPEEQRQELRGKDRRLKFATKLIESGYENFSPQLSNEYLKDYHLSNIYAFDNLILNVDRKVEKPNLLFRHKNVVVLDHEHTFATAQGAQAAILGQRDWPNIFQRHPFFGNLIQLEENDKTGIFGGFCYYLQSLVNFGELENVYNQLEEVDHPVNLYFDVLEYLRTVAANIGRFESILNRQIR